MSKIYLIIPIIFFIILALIVISPNIWKTAVGYALILILTLLTGFWLVKKNLQHRWPFIIQLFLLTAAGLLFFLFLADTAWRYLFILVFIGIIGYYLFDLYQLLFRPRLYQPYSLENMTPWLNFMITYCFIAGLGGFFGIDPFNGAPILGAILAFFLTAWLAFYLSWVNNQVNQENLNLGLIISLVLAEFYLGLSFLPFSIYFNALFFSIIFSIITNLWIKKQKKSLSLSN